MKSAISMRTVKSCKLRLFISQHWSTERCGAVLLRVMLTLQPLSTLARLAVLRFACFALPPPVRRASLKKPPFDDLDDGVGSAPPYRPPSARRPATPLPELHAHSSRDAALVTGGGLTLVNLGQSELTSRRWTA